MALNQEKDYWKNTLNESKTTKLKTVSCIKSNINIQVWIAQIQTVTK